MKYYVSVFIRGQWKFINIYKANSENEAIEFAQKDHPEYMLSANWKAEID